VVADEVRALSSRTHAATEQIQSPISEMQNTLLSWVQTMTKGKESADSCVEKVTEAHDVVDKVYSLITDISDLAIQISTASEEQSMVSQEILLTSVMLLKIIFNKQIRLNVRRLTLKKSQCA
jgi:aerotaxis receptor